MEMQHVANIVRENMKIIVTADLHHGITSRNKLRKIRNQICLEKPDAIILAGDISESAEDFDQCLNLFSEYNGIKGVIVGNHDLWKRKDGLSSLDLWERELPSITSKNDFIWMEEETIIIDKITIVGTIGWYDYSAKSLNMEDDWYESFKGEYNMDGKMIDWDKTDKEFASEIYVNLEKRLDELDKNDNIEKIIVITHVPLYSQQMVPMSSDSRYGDAYFGNFTLGHLVQGYMKVKEVVSGHTHRGIDRDFGDFRLRTVQSDYGIPGFLTIEI